MEQKDENSNNNIYSNILFVADLPNETINKDLETLFNKYQFVQASLKNSKSNKIWAQVILENENWATKARHELNGYFLIPNSANNDKSKGKAIRICKYESKYILNNNEKTLKNIDFQRNLLIKNLDAKMSQSEFYNIFLKYGDISSGKIEYDKNGISKGFGYIYYYDIESAEKAKNDLNNKEFYGKKVQIVNLIPSKTKKFNNNITIFALNLPKNVSEEEIKSIFGKYGEIIDISLTDKGYAFIKYNSIEEASACLSDIKIHPICFSGLPNLVVKFATSKEEREANKIFNDMYKNEDIYKIFFKYISDEEIYDIFDLDKKIRLFIKIIFLTEYIPSSVVINEKIKCAIVTFNTIKDSESFLNKFKEYCINRSPMFDCIPYFRIKSQINDEFINIDNYQNMYSNNNDKIIKNNNIYNINGEDFNNNNNKDLDKTDINNKYINKTNLNKKNNDTNNNPINNGPLSNDVLENNKLNFKNMIPNYSQINSSFDPKSQSFQQYINYKNNSTFSNNNKYNINKNVKTNYVNNNNNKFLYNPNINNKNNVFHLNINKNEINIQKTENNKILLKPSEFNSSPKCIYNADIQKDEIEENIIDISDSIYQIVYEKYPKEAGKITGMIKELGLNKMNLLLSKPEDLNKIIEKAYKMILETKK